MVERFIFLWRVSSPLRGAKKVQFESRHTHLGKPVLLQKAPGFTPMFPEILAEKFPTIPYSWYPSMTTVKMFFDGYFANWKSGFKFLTSISSDPKTSFNRSVLCYSLPKTFWSFTIPRNFGWKPSHWAIYSKCHKAVQQTLSPISDLRTIFITSELTFATHS